MYLVVSLLGIWILIDALYASVKQWPRLTDIGHNDSTYVPTNPSQGNTQNQALVGRKSRTSWISCITFGKRFSTASAQENTVVTEGTSHEQFCRKQLELSLAKTVRYVVVAFTLALVPSIIIVGTCRLNSTERVRSNFNFSSLSSAVWRGFAYLAAKILFSNSFANCIIYSYRNENFRTGLKKLVHGLLNNSIWTGNENRGADKLRPKSTSQFCR